jgi:23S rRNA (adenine2503-C2)-methyltransferase
MLALQGVTPSTLAKAVPPVTLAEARKIVSAAHRGGSIARPLVGVRRVALDAVRACSHVPSLAVRAVLRSAVDPFVKYALVTADYHVIETVRIPLERQGRFSVCVSSQIGCALACAFCATGRMGLRRNLETWEIVEQVRVVRAELLAEAGERVHGVVFQGMGEPMANLDRVLEAIAVMTEPSAQAIDARGITVCTSGLPAGIRRLAREAPKVRLGLSIGTARRDARRSLMPIDAAHSLNEVLEASIEHARATGLSPMWAVTPLSGVNDAREDAMALAALAADFAARAGLRPRISVIPYNAIDTGDRDPFSRSSDAREARFRDAMRELGYPTHKRYSGGGDVNAACGQLAGRA